MTSVLVRPNEGILSAWTLPLQIRMILTITQEMKLKLESFSS